MASGSVHFPPFHLPPHVDVLYCDNTPIALEPQAVRVLRYLIEQRQRVVPKEELLEKLWPDTFTTDDVLKKAVSQARRALGDDASAPRFIRTLHGRGYQFMGELAQASATQITPAVSLASNAVPPTRNDPDYDQLFGRTAEWQMLCAEYRNALNGAGRPVLIAGEPGIGKTQLTRHFSEWVKTQGGQALYGRFFDYDGNRLAPYETFLDLMRTACGLDARAERDALANVLAERFNVQLPDVLWAVETANFPRTLAITVTTDDYAAPTGDAFQAIVPLGKAFLRLSRQQPLLLVLDDLQWADDASRELLGWLMRNADAAPLLIVLLTRAEEMSEGAHPLHQWLKRQASYRSFSSLTLKPLDETAFLQTIEATFPELQIPASSLRELRQVTSGNPYFLTEMLRLLVAENVIARETGMGWQWHVTDTLRLPANLTLAAEAKLDRLSHEVREIAEQAAVIGDEFRLETLAQMTQRDEAELEFLLEEAVRRGILSEQGVSAGEHFRFYHSILRRVLYERLAPPARIKAHLRAASAIETVYTFESDRVAEALSAHYEQGRNWQRAYEWGMRAWQAARIRWQWNDAAAALERTSRAAIALEQHEPSTLTLSDKLRLQLGLGESYGALGRFHEAAAHLSETIKQAVEHHPHHLALAAAAHREMSRTCYELSRYPEAITHAQQAQTLYRAIGDAHGEVLTLLSLCRTHAALGNFADVERLSADVFTLSASQVLLIAEMRGLLGWTLALQGRYTEAQPLLTHALEHAQRTGDVRQQANLLRRLHWVNLSRGQYETSFQLAERARHEFRSVGDASGEAKLNLALGQVRLAQGLYDEALGYLQRTLQSMREIGDLHCEAETYWLMGRARCEQGECEPARELLTRALAMVRELGDRDDEFRVLTDLARVSLAEKSYAEAHDESQQAAHIAQELGNRDGVGLALAENAQALHALRRTEEALTQARDAVALLTASGSGEVWRAHYALGLVTREADKPAAIAALRETVNALKAIHDQLSPDQNARRALIASVRTTPAKLLAELI